MERRGSADRYIGGARRHVLFTLPRCRANWRASVSSRLILVDRAALARESPAAARLALAGARERLADLPRIDVRTPALPLACDVTRTVMSSVRAARGCLRRSSGVRHAGFAWCQRRASHARRIAAFETTFRSCAPCGDYRDTSARGRVASWAAWRPHRDAGSRPTHDQVRRARAGGSLVIARAAACLVTLISPGFATDIRRVTLGVSPTLADCRRALCRCACGAADRRRGHATPPRVVCHRPVSRPSS